MNSKIGWCVGIGYLSLILGVAIASVGVYSEGSTPGPWFPVELMIILTPLFISGWLAGQDD